VIAPERWRKHSGARPPVRFLQAATLFGAYAMGAPWLNVWLGRRLPDRPGALLVYEAAGLGLVVLLVAVWPGRDRGIAAGAVEPAERPRPLAAAGAALFLLGLSALLLRLVDPLYDDREFSLRSLETPAALLTFFASLPLGVAAEELIFRACQKRLRQALPRGASIAAVGLCFSLYHWAPGAALDRHLIETLVAVFAGGLILASVYERTRSVPLLIAIHLIYDLLAVAQASLNVDRRAAAEAALFALWIGGCGWLAWQGRRAAVAGSLPGPERAESHATGRSEVRPMAWLAALAFGGALPLALAWIRMRRAF
jgi:membrane protease YdiL (CAAX protease family)